MDSYGELMDSSLPDFAFPILTLYLTNSSNKLQCLLLSASLEPEFTKLTFQTQNTVRLSSFHNVPRIPQCHNHIAH